jgi:CheY-like chemotaxis protein
MEDVSRGEAVLVIDDSEDDTLLVRRAMENCCPSVGQMRSVSDVEAAQRYLEGVGEYADRTGHPMPRLIFLDLFLKRGNGRAFLEWAKAHPRFKVIPIVALSGDISERHATEILAQGANAVMAKGADYNELKQGLLHATELWLRHSIGPEHSPTHSFQL